MTEVEYQNLREITFADELVEQLLNGEKTATVRYNSYKTVHVGDTLIAKTTDGEPLALLKITHTASIPVIQVHEFLTIVDANYSSSKPKDVIQGVNKHYQDTITAETTVNVLVFTVEPLPQPLETNK